MTDIVTELKAGAAVIRTTAAMLAIGVAFGLGVLITATWDRTANVGFGWLHYQAPGVRAAACEKREHDAVAAAKPLQDIIDTTAHQAASNAVAIDQNVNAQAEEASRAIQAAPGASTALPPDVLAQLRAGRLRVRGQAAPAADGASGPKPSPAVHAASGK